MTDLTRGIYRRIYSGFIEGQRINKLSLQAEAWFWRVLATADDFGNAKAEAGSCWRATVGNRENITPKHVERWLQEMVRVGLIVFYESKGERFLHVTDFEERQPSGKNGKRIQKFPLPEESRIIQVNPETACNSEQEDNHTHTHTHTDTQDAPFDGAEFVSALADFEQHRKEIKHKLTPASRKKLYARLLSWGEPKATEALNTAVEKGWRGVFEPNGANGNGTIKSGARETAAERTARILRERDYEKSANELTGYYDPIH